MTSTAHVFKPAKLLITFVGRYRGDQLVAVSKAAGARGGTIAPGRALADSRLLQLLALADIDQEVVFTIMGAETKVVVAAIERAAAAEPKKFNGLAILLDVSGMLFRVPGAAGELIQSDGEIMSSGYQLITIIVNHGYADDVMAAARRAGAKGGTILTARGTGTEEDVKFFGISLVPEKDLLLIVAESGTVPAILEKVNALPDICQPGGGVVFYMNIEKFIPLGQACALKGY